ncbi:MAG: type III pantothenate kinase [Bacteroidetes bacterium]|nr:type III pantothenate kinase [Fibrella sp.]
MNLVIDWGNSSLKLGWFAGPVLIHTQSIASPDDLSALVAEQPIGHVIVSSTSRPADELRNRVNTMGGADWLTLDGTTPVPISKQYDTPHTLGADRVAAAVGATVLFPGRDCLVVDLGTCITADLVDAGLVFQGGLIAPGVQMRFRAMHTFTERLPLVEVGEGWPALTARSTREAMRSGVLNGMLFELEGVIDAYRQRYPNLVVLVCGGDAPLFESRLKPTIFAVPELVLVGLNRILAHNVKDLQVE